MKFHDYRQLDQMARNAGPVRAHPSAHGGEARGFFVWDCRGGNLDRDEIEDILLNKL
jgi:hypothetical protein